MTTSTNNTVLTDIKFFDLLLAQFKGSDGELPTSLSYLTQAMDENNRGRKASLIRIAREKLRNTEILGSILLQISKGQTGPISSHVDRRELDRFLVNKGVSADLYGSGLALLQDSAISSETALGAADRPYPDPKKYLQANILVEEKQIATYEQLASLTKVPNFLSALRYIQARQIQHRDEFVDMLGQLYD